VISALNSVNKIPDVNTKCKIDAEYVVCFLIQHVKMLLLHSNLLWMVLRGVAEHCCRETGTPVSGIIFWIEIIPIKGSGSSCS
jgi:hypothetical protein